MFTGGELWKITEFGSGNRWLVEYRALVMSIHACIIYTLNKKIGCRDWWRFYGTAEGRCGCGGEKKTRNQTGMVALPTENRLLFGLDFIAVVSAMPTHNDVTKSTLDRVESMPMWPHFRLRWEHCEFRVWVGRYCTEQNVYNLYCHCKLWRVQSRKARNDINHVKTIPKDTQFVVSVEARFTTTDQVDSSSTNTILATQIILK
jgi:hypothetical protein